MITVSVRNIAAELKKLNDKVAAKGLEALKAKCEKLKTDLADATPIDTGLARSSWKLESTRYKELPFKITNTVEYIKYLNQGSSKQAPAHFIEKVALRHGKPVGTIVKVTTGPDP